MRENYLSLEEVYPLLSFWSRRTIALYAAQGKIPCIKFGRKTFFIKEEIELFVESITKKEEGNYGKSTSDPR